MSRKIDLTAAEEALYGALIWDPKGPDQCDANGNTIKHLLRAVFDRIPISRQDILGNPDFNPGGRGHSLLSRFRANARGDDEMYSHSSFLLYVRYLIEGPDVPIGLAAAFDAKVQQLAGGHRITSSDVEPLRVETRRLVRLYGFRDPEQIYWLAAEYVPDVMSIGYAISIRSAAQDASRR